MNLTKGQEEALVAIRDLKKAFQEGGGIGVISGYAGTGKTTLIKVIAQENPKQFVLTPTGKAAVRVREAAGVRAMTIHRWLYEPIEDKETGEFTFKLREEVELPPSSLLIIDEASMVSYNVFKDLYSLAKEHQLNIVFIGDGFQLPPVEFETAKQDFSVLSEVFPSDFRIHLTEVLRQALDSPIIQVSMRLREGDMFALEGLGSIPHADLEVVAAQIWEDSGATVVHRNQTRHQINNGLRKRFGFPVDQLQKREPLLVVKNNYMLDIYNGEIVTVQSSPQSLEGAVAVADRYKNASIFSDYLLADIENAQIVFSDVEVFGKLNDVRQGPIRKTGNRIIDRHYPREEDDDSIDLRPRFLHANLGYALTAHKAQGSEFADVLVVIEPSVRLHHLEGRRWAYTAVTRGKKRVRLCYVHD